MAGRLIRQEFGGSALLVVERGRQDDELDRAAGMAA